MEISAKIKKVFQNMFGLLRKAERWWIVKRNNWRKNPEVEAAYRRHDIRGSIENFTKRIWDACQNQKGMGQLLRKQSLRTREDEGVQRKQEEARQRNLRLTRISRTDGWQIDIVGMLQQWENFCYMNLRFPENRRDKVSLDYFLGYQNGALWIIEGLRKEIYNAVISLKKEHATKTE